MQDEPPGLIESKAETGPIIAGLPTYNEEETIGSVVLAAKEQVDIVLCVDDGSSDSSAWIAEKCGAQVHMHRANRGYGGALKSLFSIAKEQNAHILVILDSDGQHDPREIPNLLKPIQDGKADIVIGSRFIEGGSSVAMPAYRKFGIKVISAASNLAHDLNISDSQSGFRAFNRRALVRMRFESEGMESTLEILEDADEKDLRVVEVPTVIRYDVPKGSRFTAISHGFTVLSYALVTLSQKKPLIVFGLTGASLLTAGMAIGMRSLNQVETITEGGLSLTVGPGLTAAWLGMLGLTMLFTGVLLHSAKSILRKLLRKNFGID